MIWSSRGAVVNVESGHIGLGVMSHIQLCVYSSEDTNLTIQVPNSCINPSQSGIPLTYTKLWRDADILQVSHSQLAIYSRSLTSRRLFDSGSISKHYHIVTSIFFIAEQCDSLGQRHANQMLIPRILQQRTIKLQPIQYLMTPSLDFTFPLPPFYFPQRIRHKLRTQERSLAQPTITASLSCLHLEPDYRTLTTLFDQLQI